MRHIYIPFRMNAATFFFAIAFLVIAVIYQSIKGIRQRFFT